MGQKQVYIKSNEEKIESLIKEGARLIEIKYEINISDEDLLEMKFTPVSMIYIYINIKYNSNVIHLCAWYNNIQLLEDLEAYLNEKDKHYVNRLDLNNDNALIISCVMDNSSITKMLVSNFHCLTCSTDSEEYTNYLSRNNIQQISEEKKNANYYDANQAQFSQEFNFNEKENNNNSSKNPIVICVIHDSYNCFKELIPEFSDNDDRFGELHLLAKKMQSENILRILEDVKDDDKLWESNFTLLMENQPRDVDESERSSRILRNNH